MLKKLFFLLAFVFVAIQFIRPEKNLTPVPGPNDIATKLALPNDVQRILTQACYDCHSDHTRYPWYAQVQPVGWWLANHIRNGKKHLNFSQFGAYSEKTADRKLRQIAENVDAGEMPLQSYTWIHRDALLTPAEIKTIDDWVGHVRAQIGEK